MKRYAMESRLVINRDFEPYPWKYFQTYNGFSLNFGWLWIRIFICVYGVRK